MVNNAQDNWNEAKTFYNSGESYGSNGKMRLCLSSPLACKSWQGNSKIHQTFFVVSTQTNVQ